MSSKINLSFFKAYIELDKACAERLGVAKNGVSAYIGRLVDYRFAPERSEVLPKLIKYRKCRNVIAHEENAFDEADEITKEDVQWVSRFAKSVSRKNDPVSRYERKARRYSIWRKVRLVLIAIAVLGVGAATLIILKNAGMI